MVDEGGAASFTALARSPIRPVGPGRVSGGWLVASRATTAGLVLADVSAASKVLVWAPMNGATADDLPPLGRSLRRPDALFVGSGPGEWMLMSSSRSATALAEEVLSRSGGEFATAVDMTHGRALVRLTGPHSVRALSAVCAVDLGDVVTPDGSAFRTPIAGTVTDVVRDDRDGVRSYLLHCERSAGQSLVDALLDAAAEYGCALVGTSEHL